MPNEEERTISVEAIWPVADLDKRAALARVKIGPVEIRFISIYKSPTGRLTVYFPSQRPSGVWEDVVGLPEELRQELDAAVIAAYRSLMKSKPEGEVRTAQAVASRDQKEVK